MRPGGKDPGPEGEGRCLMLPIPGLGALLGGVALPRPLSVSIYKHITIQVLLYFATYKTSLHIKKI
jgi:hypothetical protein